jgi:hypothetical protein
VIATIAEFCERQFWQTRYFSQLIRFRNDHQTKKLIQSEFLLNRLSSSSSLTIDRPAVSRRYHKDNLENKCDKFTVRRMIGASSYEYLFQGLLFEMHDEYYKHKIIVPKLILDEVIKDAPIFYLLTMRNHFLSFSVLYRFFSNCS